MSEAFSQGRHRREHPGISWKGVTYDLCSTGKFSIAKRIIRRFAERFRRYFQDEVLSPLTIELHQTKLKRSWARNVSKDPKLTFDRSLGFHSGFDWQVGICCRGNKDFNVTRCTAEASRTMDCARDSAHGRCAIDFR